MRGVSKNIVEEFYKKVTTVPETPVSGTIDLDHRNWGFGDRLKKN